MSADTTTSAPGAPPGQAPGHSPPCPAAWRRVDWHPVLTYSAVMIASGWLAGAWYSWQVEGNGAQMTICLIGALSTIFPGIPWQQLLEIQRQGRVEDMPIRRAE